MFPKHGRKRNSKMKLREIIKKIKKYSKGVPSLEEFIKGKSEPILLIRAISSYLDEFFLSKGEALQLIQFLNDEIEDLRNQVEDLKTEIDHEPETDEPYSGGLSLEELELVDQMIAEEYFCKLY